MTFKIGDEIIMTADSGKGEIFDNLTDGEYKGIVKYYVPAKSNEIAVEVKRADDGKIISYGKKNCWWFRLNDGSCITHPGMSIRLADPAKEEPTPSRWIEGQIPQGITGLFLVWTKNKQYHVLQIKGDFESRIITYKCWQDYTHYVPWENIISELPPPPPVKEVEAYGILTRIQQIKAIKMSDFETIMAIAQAERFYSQPATAEVKEKYLALETIKKCVWYDTPDISLDQFINWYQKEYEKLYFTPAALDELGVK